MINLYYWRITKYDPKNRDENGFYQKAEWISIADIGRKYYNSCFGRKYYDKVLTLEEYLFYENAYIDAIIRIMNGNNVDSLKMEALEKDNDWEKRRSESLKKHYYKDYADLRKPRIKEKYDSLKNNMLISIHDIEQVVRFILRETIWCKLTSDQMFVHFGYDYYMYIGSEKPLEDVICVIEKNGLFVEAMKSPYL